MYASTISSYFRAVSKKKEEILISEREKFVNASVKKGYSNETANKIYDDIVKFEKGMEDGTLLDEEAIKDAYTPSRFK